MVNGNFSVCVFCGARPGGNPDYMTAATDTGKMIGQNGWRLVYGAGDIGIMGEVASSALASGASALGVIPQHLVDWEVAKQDLTSLIVTENMHERKKVMFMNSDAVIVLPGGAGSLDEFFEVLTWAQLGLHKKPIILANIAGYWDPLLTLIDHVVAESFAENSLKELFTVAGSVQEIEPILRQT